MSAAYINQFRDTAISKIAQGKNEYMCGTSLQAKQRGYDTFKCGIQELLQYVKMETNPQLVSMSTDKVKTYMAELEEMKKYLNSFQQQAQPQMQQQQGQPQNNNNNHKLQQQQQPAQQPMQNSTNSVNSSKDEEQKLKQTDEQSKMRGNLSSAIVTEKPNVKWEDVAGLENAKASLKEAIIMPLRFPELFQGARKPWMGILLYGPPGTGKTFLAKACATECEGTFFSVSSSDLISKFVGESERLIKELFSMAREKKPTIIFIDEIDSMASSRDTAGGNEASSRVKTEFLVQMQGVGNNNDSVLVLGATNLPWALDSAIRRRFERRVYIPLPEINGRLALLKNRMAHTPHSMDEQEIEELARMLEGYSGSDMNTLIRDASFEPLRKSQRATHFKKIQTPEGTKWTACSPTDPEGVKMAMMDVERGKLWLPPVEFDDFIGVLPKCKPTVGVNDLKKYEEWTKEFGQEG